MEVIILAAGYGTRLYPLTKDKPKPLLEVAGKPMIEHIIHKLDGVDLNKIYIVTNDKFYGHFIDWLNNFTTEHPIEIVNDGTTSNEDRRGALGDIHFTIQENGLDDDILVVAGDNLFEESLKDLIHIFEKKHHNSIMLYDVKDLELAKHYGVVEVKQNIVTHFVEKPQKPKSTLISTGVYLFRKRAVELFEKYISQGHSPDKTGDFIEWLHKREDIYAFITDKTWYDIGSIEQLEKADKHYKEK